MTIVKEVLDAMTAVGESLDRVRTIAEAVKGGREYLETNHPEVGRDLAAMCREMKKSSHALASASSIVTEFSFVLGPDLASEAVRFNDLLIKQKTSAATVGDRISSMRGHCSVIAKHAQRIAEAKDDKGIRLTLASALGLHSPTREAELANALAGIHDEEMEYHQGVNEMARAIEVALDTVRAALGPPGAIDPAKVPDAARVLGEHVVPFERLEKDSKAIADELQRSIDELEGIA